MTQQQLFDEKRRVNMHNDMVLARMDWSVMMHRILMVLVSQIDSRGQERFDLQYVYIRDLLSDLTTGGFHYQAAQGAAERLIREPIEVRSEDGTYTAVSIFDEISYVPHYGLIVARFSQAARPYLLQLQKRFTSWRLAQTIPLQSAYAIRHFMLGKMIEREDRVNTRTFDVDDYRLKMSTEDKYSRFTDLKRRVLEPAVEEVVSETELDMDFEVIRAGRSPTGIKFTVRPVMSTPEPKSENASIERSYEPDEHVEWLTNLPADRRQDVMEEAERVARSRGWERSNERSFQAGVDVALREIHSEVEKGKELPFEE